MCVPQVKQARFTLIELVKQTGFTLIELMVTVAIIALLASIAFPMAEVAAQRSKEQELRYSLRQIREAIDSYKQAWDEGRIQKTLGESAYRIHFSYDRS